MVSFSLIANTLGILGVVAGISKNAKLKKGVSVGQKAFGVAKKVDEVGGAITQLSRQTTILSRVFIDETIADEIVLPNLMKSNHEWYAAQILAALQLSTFVDDKRTVQDVMSVVQTGDNNHRESVLGNIIKRGAGVESFVAKLKGSAGLEAIGVHGPATPSAKLVNQLTKERDDAKAEVDNLKKTPASMQLRSVTASEHRIGPMGELFEVTLNNPKTGQNAIKVPLFVQMQPSIIPAAVAARFVDLNVSPSLWQRWTQMRAGEITFWKDFIAARDLIKKQRAVVKDPEAAAAFTDFLRSVNKKDAYALADITDKTVATHSQNLANSVMVFNEETLAQAKADSAIDLHDRHDRERYFRDTYAMIVAVIDPIHQRVTVYFNGIDGELNCSYNDFRPKDSKFDPKDFMNALSAFSTNSIGRLR